jgi:hypothetical protein
MLPRPIAFDGLATADLPSLFEDASAIGTTIQSAAGPHGQNTLRLSSGSANVSIYAGAQATLGVHFRFKVSALPNASYDMFRLMDSASIQVALAINADGTLSIKRNATVLATSSLALAANTFAHFWFYATVHNTAGAYQVKGPGGTDWIAQATSQNTRTSSNNSASWVFLPGSSNVTFDFCDIIVRADSTYLGDKRVYSFAPGADGNYTQWTRTGGSSQFNALSSADGDTSRLDDNTAGHRFTCTPTGVPSGLANIKGVAVWNYMKKTDAGSRSIKNSLRIASTDYDGSAQGVPDSYRILDEFWATNPNTSVDFTRSDVAGLEFGGKMEA